MLLLIAAALAASPPAAAAVSVASPRPAGATAHATASVRIVSGVTIRWGQESAGLPRIRQTQLRGPRGELQPIRLVEFE